MSPVETLECFAKRVLGIKDQHIGVGHKLDIALCVRLSQVLVFCIGCIDDARPVAVQPVAIGAPGVRLEDIVDLNAGYTDRDILFELYKVDVGTHVVQCDGKIL